MSTAPTGAFDEAAVEILMLGAPAERIAALNAAASAARQYQGRGAQVISLHIHANAYEVASELGSRRFAFNLERAP